MAGTVEGMAVKIMVGTVGHQGAHLTGVAVIILLVDHLMEADQEEIDPDPYLILHTGALIEAAMIVVQMFMQGKLANHLDPMGEWEDDRSYGLMSLCLAVLC